MLPTMQTEAATASATPSPRGDAEVQRAIDALISNGVSVQEIARRTGASVRSVYRWLDGRRKVLPVYRTLVIALAREHQGEAAAL